MSLEEKIALPYYAVIFCSLLKGVDIDNYQLMASEMEMLAKKQDGYLGMDHAREGKGITVSYWKDLDSIRAWKNQWKHLEAQKIGREKWYKYYRIRIAKVERDYEFWSS